MTTGVLGLRGAIIQGLRSSVPELQEVESHVGNFGKEELRRYSTRAPGVRVAAMGSKFLEPVGETGMIRIQPSFAAFLICTGPDRFDEAVTLTEKLLLVISQNSWGFPRTGESTDLSTDPVADEDIDRRGVLVIGFVWRHTLVLERLAPPDPNTRADDAREHDALGRVPDPESRIPADIGYVDPHGWTGQ